MGHEPRPDRAPPSADIRRFARTLLPLCEVIELRALGVPNIGVLSGYFDNEDALVQAAESIDGRCSGVFVTINPLNRALLARANNRCVPRPKHTTADSDVLVRRRFYLDLDPIRPSGVSSTDDERASAWHICEQVRSFLSGLGFPDALTADSGNGFHLCYVIEVPAHDGGLIERILRGLAFRFDTNAVLVDRSVHNPARLIKLYGTLACKGDSTSDRPHRRSSILSCPEQLQVVPIELLERVAAMCPPIGGPKPQPGRPGMRALDIESFITRHGLAVSKRGSWGEGQRWILEQCPFNGAHTDRSAFIVQFSNGAIAAGCHHNGCSDKGWSELREVFEPGHAEHRPQDASSSGSKTRKRAQPRVISAYVPFPIEVLPFPLDLVVEEGARAIGCDPSFVALPALSMIAAAIGNARRIGIKRTWSEPAVIWTSTVGESGSHKSPAHDLALGPYRRRHRELLKEHRDAMEKFQEEVHAYKAAYRKWKTTGEGKPPARPVRPIEKRLLCSETTIEALTPVLAENARGVLLARDEMSGWLRSFNAYKGGKGGDVAMWLEMHRAGAVTVDRKTPVRTTIDIPYAALSITGGIQPAILRDVLGSEHFADGLAARLLVAMPPRKPKKWTDAELSAATEKELEVLLNRLLMLAMRRESDALEPVVVPFSAGGRAEYVKFYNEHALEQAELVGDLAAAWSKLEGYAARFALIFHLVRWAAEDPTLQTIDAVDEESVRRGVVLARWFGHEADRVYAVLGESKDDSERRELIEFIDRKGGQVSLRDLERGPRRFRGRRDAAEEALEALAALELGEWTWLPTNTQGGPPVRVFKLSRSAAAPPPCDATHPERDSGGVASPSPASPQDSEHAADSRATHGEDSDRPSPQSESTAHDPGGDAEDQSAHVDASSNGGDGRSASFRCPTPPPSDVDCSVGSAPRVNSGPSEFAGDSGDGDITPTDAAPTGGCGHTDGPSDSGLTDRGYDARSNDASIPRSGIDPQAPTRATDGWLFDCADGANGGAHDA